jgi:Protein of unknown function (DUF2510)
MSALSEQPPPAKRAKPGYYPDPLGTGRSRWWDGSSWTLLIGPRIRPDAPKGKPAPPPLKVCRHCGAQSETFDATCPHCGKGYARSPWFIVGIVAAVCIAAALFLGGCAAFWIAVVNEVEEGLDSTSISRKQFDSIQPGATRGSVERRLGEPFQTQELRQAPYGRVTCLSYNERGGRSFEFDLYELCFAKGRLYSKRAP